MEIWRRVYKRIGQRLHSVQHTVYVALTQNILTETLLQIKKSLKNMPSGEYVDE